MIVRFHWDHVYPKLVSVLENPKPIQEVRRRLLPLARRATCSKSDLERSRLLAVVLTERGNKIRVITLTTWMAGNNATTWSAARAGDDLMSKSKARMAKPTQVPKFADEDEEAKWWASAEGRDFLKRHSARKASEQPSASRLIGELGRAGRVQIALRIPAPDLAKARDIAQRKGIGYQTLLKMRVHEGLQREARRE